MGRVSKSDSRLILFTLLILPTLFISCGKPVQENTGPLQDPALPVIGVAGFGSQCPYGFTQDPFPVKLEAWNCPTGLNQLELTEPLTPIYFQVDCKKKFVSVRKPNRRMDTAWEVMPDGTFFITVDGGYANLKEDGPGRPNCAAPISVNLIGKVDCSDRDKANVDLESVYWLGKKNVTPVPSSSPSPLPGARSEAAYETSPTEPRYVSSCKLPDGCYLYAKTLIKQCQ